MKEITIYEALRYLALDVVFQRYISKKTSYLNCCYGQSTDLPTEITREDLNKYIKKTISFIESFHLLFCFIPKPLVEDVKKIRGFIEVKDYPESLLPFMNEIGEASNIRFIEVSETAIGKSAKDKQTYEVIIIKINKITLTLEEPFFKLRATIEKSPFIILEEKNA